MDEDATKLRRAMMQTGIEALHNALGPEDTAKFMKEVRRRGLATPQDTVTYIVKHVGSRTVLRFSKPLRSIAFNPGLTRNLINQLRLSLRRIDGDLSPKAEEPN